MRTRLLFTCAVRITLVLLVTESLSGTNYFVSTTGNDSNPGITRTNAWRTIQSAVNHVIPGDSIVVLPGTYVGARIQVSGTSNAPITLRAETPWTVLLNANSPSNKHSSILEIETWNGNQVVSAWKIIGFCITNSLRYGIDARSTQYLTIQSNRVYSSKYTGIFTPFSYDAVIADNLCSGNGEHGIYYNNSSDRFIIRGNTLCLNNSCGLHMNGDNTMVPPAGSPWVYDGTISDGLIENNIICSNGSTGAGINMDGVMRTTVRNNLIYASPNNSGIALFQEGGSVPSQNNLIANNTVVMNTNATGRCGWALTVANAGCVSNRILNNILYSCDSYRGSVSLAAPAIPGLIYNYNALMSRFTTDNGGTRITSFTEWKALGYDSNSIIATPIQLFVNFATNDYRLKTNSPAIDKGITLSDVLVDLEGSSRQQGSGPDIGAYERVAPSRLTTTGMILQITKTEQRASNY